ncbi:unnamed protein product [Urochloa humidicola]
MAIDREQTPHPSRRPTIPAAATTASSPANRLPVHPIPFSPRSTPPPSATPTPPPTPLNPTTIPPFSAAFDPLNMLASSSSGPAVAEQVSMVPAPKRQAEDEVYFLGDLFKESVDSGKGILGARPPPARRVPGRAEPARAPSLWPSARDVRMVGGASPEGRVAAPGRVRRPTSPPSPASPPQAPPPAAPPAGPLDEEGDLPYDPSAGSASSGEAPALPVEEEVDSEEEESVESDELDDGPDYVKIWVREGDWDRAARYAFVLLEPVSAAANPAPLIRAAFGSVAPHLNFQMFPSSRGVSLLYFGSAGRREEAMAVQPIEYNGNTVKLERVEETGDRFLREPGWLAHVVCCNYPEEHWDLEKIVDVYGCMGTVREIDPQCVPGTDRSCLRFVIELCHPQVPARVGVHVPSGRGIVLEQNATRFWPRAEQFNVNGQWIPFFGPPPPPPPAAGFDPPHQFGLHLPQFLQGPQFGPQLPPAPAQQQHAPIQPGAFMGATILHHGFINSFPLPHLPAFPIILQLPSETVSAPRSCRAVPTLLLTWHSDPVDDVPSHLDQPDVNPSPRQTQRRSRQPRGNVPTRNSERLAAKDKGMFVHATTKATQLKELHNSLAQCSKQVKLHVTKKKLMKKTKKPIAADDLLKLSDAIGLGQAASQALDRVLAIGDEAGRVLDQVLAVNDD